MTNEEMRIAIAEACGIVKQPNSYSSVVRAATGEFVAIPDYLNDLNAMHEAEKVLGLKYDQWTRELRGVCERERRCVESATAAQRAEAFLRTKGLLP